MPINKKEYNRRYYEIHRGEILEQERGYYLRHREKKLEYARHYHSTHREEGRQYRSTHKAEIEERNRQYYLNLHQQFMDGVYSHVCIFCNNIVSVEELVKHHINGDGDEEREQLGGGTTGRVRSWRKAIAEQDQTKWATAHRGCHTIFHNHQKVKESPAP